MSRAARVCVGVVGAAATLLASLTLEDSLPKAIELTVVAGGAAVVAGLVGATALYAARRRSFALQSVLVALTAVGAVAAGAMAAAHLMMDASRPVAALGVVLASSGTIGVLISLALGARLRTDSERLIEATRQIGEGDRVAGVEKPAAGELALLARELDAMQEQLEQSSARERRSDEARRQLVTWISHDLRAPLSRINVIVEALEDGIVAGPAEVAAYHSRLRAEASRLGALISDLFERSRISAGSLELELERARLAEVVSGVVASFSVVAESRRIRLRAEPPEEDPEVEISTPHVERALSNVLDNALRYTPEGGQVEVNLARRDGCAAIEIADGCGGEDLDELRRRLEESNGAHVHPVGAKTGLGLAIAKGLAEAQGGAIGVEPSERGCLFRLTFPLAGAPPLSRR
jgi:signal transduction histidine kinase